MKKYEIKKFETSSFKNGDTCAYLNLDDYAITDSIKCKIANIGDEITPSEFFFSGSPCFPYELYLKYSKGEHYKNIYVEVEYESKELELPESIFNTADGINNYIKDLQDLHYLIDIRSIAHRKKNIKLDSFIWKGLLCFDQFGQVMSVYDIEFKNDKSKQILNSNTIYEDVFGSHCEKWTKSMAKIPECKEVCPVCGKGWTINNIQDYLLNRENYKYIGYHKECYKQYNNKNQLQEFKDAFSQVYDLDELVFIPTPNKYCSCDNCASWFIVSTPDGNIQIGWRKRVINIKWLDNYKQFTETFESEDVTRGFDYLDKERFIHAWNIEKAIEYLSRAKNSIEIYNPMKAVKTINIPCRV